MQREAHELRNWEHDYCKNIKIPSVYKGHSKVFFLKYMYVDVFVKRTTKIVQFFVNI